ncbi:MAG: hypothetical protein WC197_05470 [Candidatus Gastranaerophilaceae bacterium]|jgi:hypothetical protein
MKFIKNLKNYFDFYIRQKMRFTRKGFYLQNEPKGILIQKEQEYLEKYNLYDFKNHSTKRNYLENLDIIELLETYLNLEHSKTNLKILDIGSKNWFYATGQNHFFKYNGYKKEIFLTGIELDAFRVYISFYSRYDSAIFNIRNLENTKYIAGDFLEHNKKYDYICCFFPFVIEEPLLHWGLPLKHFKPHNLFKHAYESLNKNGEIIIINQDEEEYLTQQQILAGLNIPFETKGEFKSTFLDYEHKRYVLKSTKP